MNKIDEFIENFIIEAILFFKTNFLLIQCPQKFPRISYARSKRKKFLIQNKYLFFIISCFFFFTIQTILEINTRDIIKFFFTSQVYFIDYQTFLNHVKTNVLNYQFNITGIFFFIFPIGFIPLIISWIIVKLIKNEMHYNYIVYLLSFQINTYTISVIIFAASFAILNSPFTNFPYSLSTFVFVVLSVYILFCTAIFLKTNQNKKQLYKSIIAIFLIFSNILILSETINLKNKFNKFLQQKPPIKIKTQIIRNENGSIGVVSKDGQPHLVFSLGIFNHTDDALILFNNQIGTITYNFNKKKMILNLVLKTQLNRGFFTNIPAGEALGVQLLAKLPSEKLSFFNKMIFAQQTNNIISPADILISAKSGKGKKINIKNKIAYKISGTIEDKRKLKPGK